MQLKAVEDAVTKTEMEGRIEHRQQVIRPFPVIATFGGQCSHFHSGRFCVFYLEVGTDIR